MTIELETLLVRLKADVEDFQKAMEESRQTSDEFSASAGGAADKTRRIEEESQRSVGSVTELKSALDLSRQVLQGLKTAYDSTIGAMVEYAGQVRALSTDIGASAQESSKLIQAADDMGIGYESLMGALETAIRKGVKPSIEGIGDLADRYLAIQDPIARTEFLMDKFGRAGADMAEMMKLGSAGIRELGEDAKAAGLVLSDEDVKAARAFELALDELEDMAKGLAITIGKDLVGGLAAFLEGTNLLIEAIRKATTRHLTQAEAILETTSSYEEYVDAMRQSAAQTGGNITAEGNLVATYGEGLEATESLVQAHYLLTEAEYESAKGAQAEQEAVEQQTEADKRAAREKKRLVMVMAAMGPYMSDMIEGWAAISAATDGARAAAEREQEMLDVVSFALAGPLASAFDDYHTNLADLQAEHDALTLAMETALKQGYSPTGEKLTELSGALDDNEQKQAELEEQIKRTTAELIYQKVAASLDADAALELGRRMGLISETDYNLATAISTLTGMYDDNKDSMISADEAADGFYQAMDLLRAAAADGKLELWEVNRILNQLDGETFSTTLDVTVTGDPLPSEGETGIGEEGGTLPPVTDVDTGNTTPTEGPTFGGPGGGGEGGVNIYLTQMIYGGEANTVGRAAEEGVLRAARAAGLR